MGLLLKLTGEIGAVALRWWLVLLWIAWWLWAVNWSKAWPVLSRGAWVPFVLVVVLAALAWSQVAPSSGTLFGVLALTNFWWQLVASAALAATALFCGWLQGLMGWTPTDVSLAVHAAADDGDGHH